MSEERYTLTELAQATGLEPRTIRHYISEELLRGPEALGRNAYYTRHHLDRLNTIKLLKETYGLSMNEIRRYVHMAGDEQIQVHVVAPSAVAEAPMLYGPPMEIPEPSEGTPRPVDRLVETLRKALGGSRVKRQAHAQTVLRLEVTSDITLEIKGQYAPREVAAFEVLADHIRVVLLGGMERKSK